jgi:hypothetical protein
MSAPILKPDILNRTTLQFMEIKPLSFRGVANGAAKLWIYSAWLGEQGFTPDTVWEPPSPLHVQDRQVLVFNVQGILFYTDRLQLEPKLITVIGFEELFRILRQEHGTGPSRVMNEYVFARQAVAAAAVAGLATGILLQAMAGFRVSTFGFA